MNKKELKALIDEISATPEALETYVTNAEEAKAAAAAKAAEYEDTIGSLMAKVEELSAAKQTKPGVIKHNKVDYAIVTPKFYHKGQLINLHEKCSAEEIEIAIKGGNLKAVGE